MKALVLLLAAPPVALWGGWVVQRVWFWHLTELAPAPSVPALAALLLIFSHLRSKYQPELEVDWEYAVGLIGYAAAMPLILLGAAWVIEVLT